MAFLSKKTKLKTILGLSIGILLCASVVLNILLFDRVLSYYKSLNLLRLEPLETSLLPDITAKKAEAIKNNRLMILFGDSRIANWRPVFEMPGWVVLNKGIRGQTTRQLILRLHKDVLAYSPDVVILQLGINDLKSIGLFPDRKRDIVINCRKNLFKIIDRLAAEKIQTIVLTIFPTKKPGFIRNWFWSSEIYTAIEEINAELKSNKNKNVSVIDTYEILGDMNFIRTEFEKDTLHLNYKGYEKINERLGTFFNNILDRPSLE